MTNRELCIWTAFLVELLGVIWLPATAGKILATVSVLALICFLVVLALRKRN